MELSGNHSVGEVCVEVNTHKFVQSVSKICGQVRTHVSAVGQ
jgi:hypothetical protein